jgi:hypothetical protein
MGTELTVLNNTEAIEQGGLGIDFGNKLFAVKPGTLTIVQPNSQIEGAIKGKLRISETGDMFDEIWATLLVMPHEQRQYHIGNAGELNRTFENLMCYSNDLIKPDPKAKIPQAVTCANCPKQDWGPWREYKEANGGSTNKALIPPCDAHYQVTLLDTVYQLPVRMYIRSKAKPEFESGMQNLSRVIAMAKAQGKNPNLFDVKFKLSVKEITSGKFKSFVPRFSDFKMITEDEREKFGAIYLSYIDSLKKPAQKQLEAEQESVAQQEAEVNAAIDGEYVGGLDDEIPF